MYHQASQEPSKHPFTLRAKIVSPQTFPLSYHSYLNTVLIQISGELTLTHGSEASDKMSHTHTPGSGTSPINWTAFCPSYHTYH